MSRTNLAPGKQSHSTWLDVEFLAGFGFTSLYQATWNSAITPTQTTFAALWHEAFTQIGNVKKYFEVLLDYDIERMPWNIRRALDQVNEYCSHFFLHVASFMCRGVMVPEKALSFHAKAMSCFNKGKLGKGLQCGRAFQLGRIGGNFLVV